MTLRRAAVALGASTFGVALCLLVPACQDGRPPADAGEAGAPDGGPVGTPDGGAFTQDADTPDADMEAPGSEYDREDSLAAARSACFDGVDNDGDGVMDCDDGSCQQNVPSCCVGASSATCCDAAAEVALPFDECGGALSTCAAVTGGGFDVFGSRSPRAEVFGGDASEEMFLPGGPDDDSGVLFPGALDPRAGTIRLDATIASSMEAPSDGVIDAIAIGLVDASVDPSSLPRVFPVAAVVVSRNRQEVSLVVAGETVERWPLGDDAFHDYTLSLAPDGVVSLRTTGLAGADEAHARLVVDRPLRAAVYGRGAETTNPGPLPVRASRVGLRTDACDMPNALTRGAGTVVPAPEDELWAAGHPTITSPHVIAYEEAPGTTRRTMALMIDGEIHLAEPTAGGFTPSSAFGAPVFDPSGHGWATDGVSDPALRWTGEALELWLTGWSGDVGTVARASWDEATGRFVRPEIVLDPEAFTGITAFDGAAPFEHDGALQVVVREHRDEGPRIALYGLAGASPVRTAEVARPSGDLFAFDRDEVAAPGVIVEGGVIRVYYAGRRGTRWSIGLRVSDDEEIWRTPPGAPVLRESGEGFDAIGVSEPSPVRIDGALRLYYAGLDGARVRIGVVTGTP